MADVFLSYAREDRSRAEQIARGLSAMGLEVFWDTEIPPGQTWSDYIESKLNQSRSVVVLWSQHSTKSQWVREEARMGRDKSKLIPVIIDGAPPPLGFGEVQAADLSAWRGDANQPQWTRFANAVYAAARGSAPPPQASTARPQPAFTPQPQSAHTASGGEEKLSPIGYVQKCLRLYFNGKGRARRSEYWWWALFAAGVSFVAILLDFAVSGVNTYTNQPNQQVFYTVVGLALLAPGISVMSRRFHDVGLNGWLVAALVGVYVVGAVLYASAMEIGALLMLAAGLAIVVIALIPSKPGENQYGPNPKGV